MRIWKRKGCRMLKLYLIEKGKTSIRYEYYPEDKGKAGVIVLGIRDGVVSVESLAGNDSHGVYAPHAVSKVKEFLKNGIYPNEATVAWY